MPRKFTKEFLSAKLTRETQAPVIEEVFGSTPIVFCAPHAKRFQRKNGSFKPGEPSTGELALLMAKRLKAVALVQNSGDPVPQFRQRLKNNYPGYVLVDLHGMKDDHGIDVNLGVGLRPSAKVQKLNAAIMEAVMASGFGVSVNNPFPAIKKRTLTRYFQSLGHTAVQVEMTRRIRNSHREMEKLCKALADASRQYLACAPQKHATAFLA